jgi:hypothetical protein
MRRKGGGVKKGGERKVEQFQIVTFYQLSQRYLFGNFGAEVVSFPESYKMSGSGSQIR